MVAAMECEARDVLSNILDNVETHVQGIDAPRQVCPLVEYSENKIYKNTLVSQLNGNPFLSKDRLMRIRNSTYFNNAEDYLSAVKSSSTCLLGLESDCAMFMMQRSSTKMSLTLKATAKQ